MELGHSICSHVHRSFGTYIKICQLEIMMGEPLFDVEYDDFDT